jgi:hypothetical protein
MFWNITASSPMKVNRSFGGTSRLHLQGRRISQTGNQSESRWQAELSRWFLAWHILRPSRSRRNVPPKRLLTFNRLHAVTSQKTELFLTTAAST